MISSGHIVTKQAARHACNVCMNASCKLHVVAHDSCNQVVRLDILAVDGFELDLARRLKSLVSFRICFL